MLSEWHRAGRPSAVVVVVVVGGGVVVGSSRIVGEQSSQ